LQKQKLLKASLNVNDYVDHVDQKKVEDYLNEVSYSDLDHYVPSQFAIEFINFIKLVNAEQGGEEHPSPVVHMHMLDKITNGGKNIINLCSRGLAKTTMFGEYLILYIAVYGELPGFGRVDYGLYVSDSIDNGVKKMRYRLERRRENSSFLQRYIPHAKFTDIRWYFKNAEGKELVFSGHGAKTGVRGTVELNTRPQIAILDDLISDEDARSPTVINSVEETVYKAIKFALHPTRNMIIWSGTPFNSKDPLYKAVESGAWTVNAYPVCETFPCTKSEFKGAWPSRFTYEYVKDQYDTAMKLGRVDTFNQELMLRIMSDEDRLIKDHEIIWYNRDRLLENRGAYNFYITTDFATSEKQSADNSVISVWAYNSNGDWYWVDGICERQNMSENWEDLFRLVLMYKPISVGIEISGQQGGFINWCQEKMQERNIWFNLASDKNSKTPGIRPNTNKFQRFNGVVPWFKAQKIRFPAQMKDSKPMKQAVDELSLVSMSGFKSKHDDFSDTISMLAVMPTWKPSEPAPEEGSMQNKRGSRYFDDYIPDHVETSTLDSYLV
jgi:phage terminase large subunit-like protein